MYLFKAMVFVFSKNDSIKDSKIFVPHAIARHRVLNADLNFK